MTKMRAALLFLRWRFCELWETSDGFITEYLRNFRMIFMYATVKNTPGSHCVPMISSRSVTFIQKSVATTPQLRLSSIFVSIDKANQTLVSNPKTHERTTAPLAIFIVICFFSGCTTAWNRSKLISIKVIMETVKLLWTIMNIPLQPARPNNLGHSPCEE